MNIFLVVKIDWKSFGSVVAYFCTIAAFLASTGEQQFVVAQQCTGDLVQLFNRGSKKESIFFIVGQSYDYW